jgi:colicin import membrane protein
MSDQKESSVLFSLKELMNIEEDRIKKETSDLEAKARADREAKEAADRAARENEERRIREEEERRRSDEMRRREEAARLEAIQHGELERARLDAEQRARMEAMAAQQRHEQQLATIQHQSGSKKYKLAAVGVGAVMVVGAIIGGVAFKASKDEAAKKEAVLVMEKTRLEEEKRQLQEAVSKAEEKERDLNDQLKNAQNDAERAQLLGKLEAAREATKAAKRAQGGGGGGTPDKPPPPKKQCPPGDPLCSEL